MLTVQAAWLHKIEGARLVYYSSTFIVERLWGKGELAGHTIHLLSSEARG
jgi:phosphoribosyl-AMP cyclohydrolase